ncbi:MAG: aminopeptidase P family N-terminal domain-containing protein, partial [Stellaceae bacterium]
MRTRYEVPRQSLAERDRRWAAVRRRMTEQRLDCLVLTGWPVMYDFNVANARYLCPVGGNSTHNILVFPIDREPTCFVFSAVGLQYWFAVQDWVKDVRPRTGPWGDTVVTRLKELGLARGTIGLDGLAGPLDPDGWLPHSMYERMRSGLPEANLVAIDDLMEMVRAVKSAEEIAVLRKAAALGDAMLARCRATARAGTKECEVYAGMREAMLAGGGEEPTLFLWASDP